MTTVIYEVLKNDYDVISVAQVTDALAVLAQHRADIVILDYFLPGGSSHEVAELANETSVPVIWMTSSPGATTQPDDRRPFLLMKPFPLADLVQTLATALEAAQKQPPSRK
jgi:DNA-binding NtrC family response regulator